MSKHEQADKAQSSPVQAQPQAGHDPAAGPAMEAVEASPYLTGLAQAVGGSPGARPAAWLGGSRLQSAQRHTLAAQIGHAYGNRHMQRLVATLDDDNGRVGVAAVQRQDGGGTAAPAVPPTFRLSPSALTVGMGERMRLNAYITGVTDRSELGGTVAVMSPGIHLVPQFISAAGLLRRRHLTFYATESGRLRVSLTYQGSNVDSNDVQVTVQDPTFRIRPDATIVDKGGRQRFTSQVQGIFARDELGGTVAVASSGIGFIPGPLNIRRLQPAGTFEASASAPGFFTVSFDYFGRNFDSNQVTMAIIESTARISTAVPHYYLGQEFDVNVATAGIGDPEQVGGIMAFHSPGLELIDGPSSLRSVVPSGAIRARMTQNQPAWIELSFDYLGGTVRAERIHIAPLPPSIVAAPVELSVGTRQTFPLHYRLQGFHHLDEVGGRSVFSTAPVSVVEHMQLPTQPDESGQVTLQANNQVGTGIVTLGISYYGQAYNAPPVTVNVTPGPAASATPDRIFFDTDKDEIRSDAAAALLEVATRLRANPNLVAGLEGHADTRHTDEYNANLSYRRATSTRRYLINVLNVNPAQVPEERVIGWGESFPAISPETNPAEFQANRRVEIVMTERATGEELAPMLRLTPHTIRAGVGQRFSLGYAVRNVHDADEYAGSALTMGGSVSRVGDGMPTVPGGETGTITFQAGDEPGRAEITLSITYAGNAYDSNTVNVEIIGPSIRLEPARWDNLEIGNNFAIQYTIDGMPDPTAYGGSSLLMAKSGGGEAVVQSGLPSGITGRRMADNLQVQATSPGEVNLEMSIVYNGRQVTSNQVYMKIYPHRYQNFSIRLLGGGEGGEIGGAGYYTFELRENGPGGRTAVLRFAGGGITGGLPGGGFGTGSWSTFTTTVPMRAEDFDGGGRIASGGVYAIYGGGYTVLVFYCGDKPTQQVEGWGHGWGLAAGASWYHGFWKVLGHM
jgi:outer membrane protein OmpA-like peptidoglycan-associated protein